MTMTLTSLIGSSTLADAVVLAKICVPYPGLLAVGMLFVLWCDRITDARIIKRIRALEAEIDTFCLSRRNGSDSLK